MHVEIFNFVFVSLAITDVGQFRFPFTFSSRISLSLTKLCFGLPWNEMRWAIRKLFPLNPSRSKLKILRLSFVFVFLEIEYLMRIVSSSLFFWVQCCEQTDFCHFCFCIPRDLRPAMSSSFLCLVVSSLTSRCFGPTRFYTFVNSGFFLSVFVL